jgi:phosphoribosyl-ATP pyrophosphohydrolase/phosphoribosyl-AMP cyclohydrolase
MSRESRVANGESLVAGIVQDADTGRVLMLGYLNQEAIDLTVATGFVHFWSRSRQELWKKGGTSGNTLRFLDMAEDCDGDALLIQAHPDGPTCHTGERSCFDASRESRVAGREPAPFPPSGGGRTRGGTKRTPEGTGSVFSLDSLWEIIQQRKVARPDGSYTVTLLDGGVDLAGRKVLEEAGEVLMAAKDHANGAADDRRVAEEAGDLLYHLLVLLAERSISLSAVLDVLDERAP